MKFKITKVTYEPSGQILEIEFLDEDGKDTGLMVNAKDIVADFIAAEAAKQAYELLEGNDILDTQYPS